MNRESIFLEVHLINLKQRRTDRYRFAGTENIIVTPRKIERATYTVNPAISYRRVKYNDLRLADHRPSSNYELKNN